ncbi:MAG: hypothetical protein HY823_15535 [Acidobacteria bacterium]|nr:hypothetical protein [Acidobacteriota bacterium]
MFSRAFWVAACLVVLEASGLQAQTLPLEQEFMTWDGDKLVRILGSDRVRIEAGPGRKPREWPIPPGSYRPRRMDFFQGALWTSHAEARDGKPALLVHRIEEGKGRRQEAWCPESLPQGRVARIHPLPGDRFLLVARRFFGHDKKFSFLAVARPDREGRLEFKDLVEVDLGDKFFEGLDPAAPDKDFLKSLYLGGFASQWVRGRDHLAFANGAVARILLVDVEKLTTRFVKVFPGHPDPDAWTRKAFELEWPLLGCQPSGDGGFILASRTEEAMLKARAGERAAGQDRIPVSRSGDPDRDRETLKSALQNPRRKEQLESHAQAGAVVYPDILWWDMDPGTGKLTRRIPNSGIPESLHQAERLREFRFRLTVQGLIEMD